MMPGNCLSNKWFVRSPKQFDPILRSSTIEKRNLISTGSDRAVLHSDDDPLLNSWQGQTGASDQLDESAFGPSSVRGRSGPVRRLLGEDSAHKDALPLDQSSAHAGRLLMGVRSAQDEYTWFLHSGDEQAGRPGTADSSHASHLLCSGETTG